MAHLCESFVCFFFFQTFRMDWKNLSISASEQNKLRILNEWCWTIYPNGKLSAFSLDSVVFVNLESSWDTGKLLVYSLTLHYSLTLLRSQISICPWTVVYFGKSDSVREMMSGLTVLGWHLRWMVKLNPLHFHGI